MKILRNKKGFGIVESMIALGLVGVGTYFIMQGLDMFDSSKVKTDTSINLESTLNSVLESVKSNITMEKVDFQAEEKFFAHTTYKEVKKNLALCWFKDGLTSAANSPDCQSRIGYVVAPLMVGNLPIRGLYKVTIRMTHDELFPNSFRQYEFIVKGP